MKSQNLSPRIFLVGCLALAALGFLDARLLTLADTKQVILPCTTGVSFVNCGKVLTSPYAHVFGIPLALVGMLHYGLMGLVVIFQLVKRLKWLNFVILFLATFGALFSLYLMVVQIFVIGYVCLYCTFSALNSLVLAALCWWFFKEERGKIFNLVTQHA